MTVEITSGCICDGIIRIFAVDVSEEHLQWIERSRDNGMERKIEFVFDTHFPDTYKYIRKWLKKQKATQNAKTWGEAVHAVIGTITELNTKFRSWD